MYDSGSGIIEQIGSAVPSSLFKVGDRVAFFGSGGAYAEYLAMSYHSVVKIPQSISLQDAVACMVQGLTAYYLSHDIPSVRSNAVLIHAAAGGTGRFLTQIMSKVKKTPIIIGTVGSEDKVELAYQLGCTHVIQYKSEDVVQRVKEITNGQGVDIVFDGVGKDTYQTSLNSLGVRGTFVSFGNASGAIPPVNAGDLASKGSLLFTRPKMGDFVRTREEWESKTEQVFGWVQSGIISVNIHKVFDLKDAADAHREIEGRKTLGKILLKVHGE